MKKLLLNSIVILCGAVGWSQSPLYKSSLPAVNDDGFYRIMLSPDIVAGSLPGLPDVRVNDRNGNSIPYVLKTENPVSVIRQFIEFPIVSAKKEADQLTHITLKNDSSRTVSELLLYVTNTVANRTISLSGSNDSVHWFIIKEFVPIEGYFHEKDLFIQSVLLPVTAYKYYEIIINGKNLLPVNVIKAGINEDHFGDGNYQELPSPVVAQRTKDKITYVDINFRSHYQVDQLSIKISKPKYFKRSVNIFDNNTLLGSYSISSGSPIMIPARFKSNTVRLEIDNQDNPSLIIDSIQAFQLTRSLISYLDKGTAYNLSFGDSGAKAPSYDLAVFSDSTGRSINDLQPGVIEKLSYPAGAKNADGDSKLLLWIITGVILIVLLMITFKMINEVNKKKNE